MEAPGLSAQKSDKPVAGSNQPASSASVPHDAASSGATQRPEWVPESHWDAEAGSIKYDEFGQHYSELATLKQQHDERLAAIPEKPEDVKFSMPEGWQPPEGVVLDDNDPLLAKAREVVVAEKIDPAHANRFYQLFVEHQLAEANMLRERLSAEKQKLGANLEARIDALNSGLVAAIGKDKTRALIGDVSKPGESRLFTAAQTEALESLLKKITTQGAVNPGAAPHQPKVKEIPWQQRMWPKRFEQTAAKAG